MKTLLWCTAALSAVLWFSISARADCPHTTICVTSFTLSPNEIPGDDARVSIGTVTVSLPPGTTQWVAGFGGTVPHHECVNGTYNYTGGGSCNVSGPTAIVRFHHYNGSGQVASLPIKAQGDAYLDPGITLNLLVDPFPNPTEPPPNEPDLPCPNCGQAGAPINVANGNTWITQQDYSIPGLGGGLRLTRTWNSLWPLTNPPEQIGIFGDSWRSNFEERIQVLTGGVVKYWKGNGSALFYTYDSLSGTYRMTAPADDQTTLAYNSPTSQWIVPEKNGTQHIFNNAGYLVSIIDLNGNTITINVDATNQNRIASVTDASGRVLTFNYANASYPRLCTSISDSVGTFSSYTYDYSTGRLTQVFYPDGSQFNFQYNDSHSNTLISSVVDSLSKVVEAHTYDSQRRGLTSQQANDANGNAVNKVMLAYQYLGNSWQNHICDSTLNKCNYINVSNVAQRHYVVSTSGSSAFSCATCGFQGTASSTISDSGYQLSYKDPNGETTVYTYDSQGNMLSKALPKGDYFSGPAGNDTWNYTYNSFGQALTVTDPLGTHPGDPNHTTTYSYDTHGNLQSVTTPSPDGGTTPGSVTQFTYNSNGTLHTITDPLNHVTTINYCGAGVQNCPVVDDREHSGREREGHVLYV